VALSYLAITCYLAYNTLSHVYFLVFLGEVKFTYVVSVLLFNRYNDKLSNGGRCNSQP